MTILHTALWTANAGFVALSVYFIHLFITQKRVNTGVHYGFFTTVVTLPLLYLVLLRLILERNPPGSAPEALIVFATFLALFYMLLEIRLGDRSMGALIIPLATLLFFAASTNVKEDAILPSILENQIFVLHALLLLVAYAAFAISFIASLLYLRLDREIQDKSTGFFFARLPSLPFFDRLNVQAVMVGFAFSTIGIGVGFYMANTLWPSLWQADPKSLSVLGTWLLYGAFLALRSRRALSARQLAYISLTGFPIILFIIFVVNRYLSKLHSFWPS